VIPPINPFQLIWSAAALAVLTACAPPPKPPFDLAHLTPGKVLDVIEWLGSLDLSRPEPVMEGLHLTPELKSQVANLNGREVLNITKIYLDSMGNGSKTTFDYAIYDPRGPAAHGRRGEIIRAFIRWDLRSEGTYVHPVTCVRVQDLQKRFGSPVNKTVIPDFGGASFEFRVSSQGGWQTYTAGYEGPDGCINTLTIRQTDR
jgi:hypothetical protein